MAQPVPRSGGVAALAALALFLTGCATYSGLVKPVPKLSALSPELENLTDAKIETYLKADARPAFPTALAVAKLSSPYRRQYYRYGSGRDELTLEVLHGDEAQGWRDLLDLEDEGGHEIINQVQFVSPLLASGKPDLKRLRDAAALLHVPILLAYMQVDSAEHGYNDAAIAYWSIVGLFVVPGNTVGHHTVCQAVLVDTRSGFILATAQGESIREENVLAGAVDIARRRTANQARTEAVINLQAEVGKALTALTAKPAPPQP